MRIIGFDQSTTMLGYAVIDVDDLGGYELIKSGAIPIENTDIINAKVLANITMLINAYQPELFGVEDTQFQKNAKTFKILCKLLGVIEHHFDKHRYCYMTISPPAWKKELGVKGRKRAEQKIHTQEIIEEVFGFVPQEDEADAIGIAMYVAGEYTRKVLGKQ